MEIDRSGNLKIVFSSIETLNEEKEDKDNLLALEEETRLLGRGAKLDSLGLVTLIVDIEQRLADEIGMEISLTDEKAMSQTRSPFRDVKSLVNYICSLPG